MQEAIVKKIQALLRLANSDNANEAGVAMQKAQQLLAEHHLTMDQVRSADTEESDNLGHACMDVGVVRGMNDRWRDVLAGTVAKIFFCKALSSSGDQMTLIFVGRESNVKIAIHAYEQLQTRLTQLEAEAWKFKTQRYRQLNGESFYQRHSNAAYLRATHRKDWILGACSAISHRFAQTLESSDTFALQRRFKQENEEYAHEQWSVGKPKDIVVSSNTVEHQGYQKGREVDIYAGLTAHELRRLELE